MNEQATPTTDDSPAPIGHNEPPATLGEQILRDHRSIFDRIAELTAAAERMPDEINDEETHKKALDQFKMMRVALRTAEETRKIEKEPFTIKAKEVDGTFAKHTGPFKKLMDSIKEKTERFAQVLKERERIAREEKARREREEAERKEREAREAEERRLEAERKKREAEEAAAKAQAEREAAERRAREERERAEEARQRAAEERRRAQEAEDERAKAEAQRKADDAKRLKEEAEERARQEREAAQEALEKRRAAEAEAREAKADERVETRIERESLADAVNAEKRAVKFERRADAGSADLSRSKSDRGTTGSLSETWVATITDYDAIPLEKIRGFIHREAVEKAVNLFVKAGGRDLPGVVIEKEDNIRIV